MPTLIKAGRYEISGELGRGAMGVVYRATDPVIGRTVAVKTLQLSEEGTGLTRAELLARFQTEARAAGLLTHPNIVVIFDAGEEGGLFFITMELVEGKSLQGQLDSGQMFPLPRVIRIMEQTCSALQFAHDRNIVHRDIKPANLMLTPDDTVKVTDFGTAKILQFGTVQQTAHVMGTPSYMSPEQVKGRVVDGRSDIFSLGVLLYEMVTGEKPFPGQNITTVIYKIVNEDPVSPRDIDSSIHPGLSAVIMKALEKDPEIRYQSCRDFVDDLRNYRSISGEANPNATMQLGGSLNNTPRLGNSSDAHIAAASRTLNARATSPSQTPLVRRTGPVAPALVHHSEPEPAKTGIVTTVLAALFLIAVIVFGAQKIRPIFQQARQQNRAENAARDSNWAAQTVAIDSTEKTLASSPSSSVPIENPGASPAAPLSAPGNSKPLKPPVTLATVSANGVLAPSAAEYKGRVEQLAAEKHFANRLQIKGSGMTLEFSGNLHPAEYNELMSFLRNAPRGVQVVDDVAHNQNSEAAASVTAASGPEVATPGRAAIRIATNVSGAIASLAGTDSNHQCETPCSFFGLAPGIYNVQIMKSGFQPVRTELQLDPGKVAEQRFQLEPLAMGLYVSSDPEGADVFIGGNKQSGQTPVTLPLAPGTYNLSVILSGYEHFAETVQVHAEGQSKVSAELHRASSYVAWAKIDSNPEGAEIFVDDLPSGRQTPARIQIPSGIHHITLKLNGYSVARQTIETSDGGTVTILRVLKKK